MFDIKEDTELQFLESDAHSNYTQYLSSDSPIYNQMGKLNALVPKCLQLQLTVDK